MFSAGVTSSHAEGKGRVVGAQNNVRAHFFEVRQILKSLTPLKNSTFCLNKNPSSLESSKSLSLFGSHRPLPAHCQTVTTSWSHSKSPQSFSLCQSLFLTVSRTSFQLSLQITHISRLGSKIYSPGKAFLIGSGCEATLTLHYQNQVSFQPRTLSTRESSLSTYFLNYLRSVYFNLLS